jgi:hemerythrin-like domain-containing protein
MIHPPLHRHPALQPLSREHYNGLRQARALAQSAEKGAQERVQAVQDFLQAWHTEIAAHFHDEERLLIPLLDESDRQRLLNEHALLRQFAEQCAAAGDDPPPALVGQFGILLRDHIRWEERQLFEAVQRTASQPQMAAIAQETQQIEAARPGSRRRGAPTSESSQDAEKQP